MVKVNRKIPVRVQKARLRDYHINKEYQERNKIKYPDCIGTYPECQDLKIGSIIFDCKLCPHFCSKAYKKIIGGKTMKEKAEEKSEKTKKDKTKQKQERIQKMVDNYEHLKPAVKAWVKIYASKGLLSKEQLEKVGLKDKGEV